jgi:23S rRNA maturation mini-RNase III
MAYERKTFDLIISEELRAVLSEIESDSQVAKLLLKMRHDKEELVEDPINFISVAQDKTKISYLTKDRIDKIEDPSLYWSSSRRFAVKPGGFISKIFKDISAKEVEKFSNLYRAQSNKSKFTLGVVDGLKMLTYYHINSYAQERGTLGASCMKYDNCQDYLGIYTNNTNKVKMLVMLNEDGGLMGRALLWDFENYKIMDRIYTIADEEFAFQFKKWATDNGYLYKSEQNWYNTLNFENLSTPKQELRLSIKLDEFSFRRYPYVDTFKFFDEEAGVLKNYMDGNDFKTLCTSDGGKYDSDYLVFDDIDRVLRHRGDSVYVRYLDIRTSHNNVNYSEINDQYILRRDARYDEEINEYLFNEENDKFNNIEKISERKEYLRKRREKMVKKDSQSSWIESLIGYSDLTGDNINELYQRITRVSRDNSLQGEESVTAPE